MARTTFSGPVRSGYQGGNADPQNPITPTTINAGEVIEVDQGTGAYGFYSRVEPTVGFGSSTFQTPGEAYGIPILCLAMPLLWRSWTATLV
jgi:hypothetical protein